MKEEEQQTSMDGSEEDQCSKDMDLLLKFLCREIKALSDEVSFLQKQALLDMGYPEGFEDWDSVFPPR